MTVAEFAAKFKDMVAYSSQALYAPDERWKINQFNIGLQGEMEHNVGKQCYNTYVELLKQCYIVEYSLKNIQQERKQVRQSQGDYGRTSQYLKPIGSPSKGKQVQVMRPVQPPQCQRCNMYHVREC